MNWKEISDKHPKAFKSMLHFLQKPFGDLLELELEHYSPFEYFESEYCGPVYEDFGWNIRNLYDFFDENRILISIDAYTDSQDGDIVWFDPEIFGATNNIGIYHTRPEAEADAFEEAFKILEERL